MQKVERDESTEGCGVLLCQSGPPSFAHWYPICEVPGFNNPEEVLNWVCGAHRTKMTPSFSSLSLFSAASVKTSQPVRVSGPSAKAG
mmetsp:Transcript_33601/g.52280  ORF Transcript_33601/g.52280 Transcript_33601/m.52280 type:complete len:87 (+) Transcript_33601:1693-1953(+)